MLRRSALRASDADREYVADRLRDAAAEGRIRAEELEHRLGIALSARTYGQLDAVLADLPREWAVDRTRRRQPIRLRPATVVALLVLFPVAVAIATALFVAVVALVTAWAVVIALVALLLGPRVRTLRGPWAVGSRYPARRRRVGTPWL